MILNSYRISEEEHAFYEKRNEAHFNELLEHYVRIAQIDKKYAWARVKQLQLDTHYTHKQYELLPEALTKRMRELNVTNSTSTLA